MGYCKGELSITATILSTYSIFTIILSVIFNGEHLQLLGWLFVAFAIIGTVIVSLPDKSVKDEVKDVAFILYAIIVAVCIGTSDAFSKGVIDRTSIGTFYFAVSISQFVAGVIYLKLSKEPISQFKDIIAKFSDYKYSIIGSLVLSVSTLLMFYAFNFAPASIVSPLAGTFPVFTIVLALVFLKEKLTLKSSIGLLMVIIAVVGISFF